MSMQNGTINLKKLFLKYYGTKRPHLKRDIQEEKDSPKN